ncbi:MAG: hypothetical protein WDM71_07470 [Ferruginibacter sp.]
MIEGLATINRHSVIGQGKYPGLVTPHETMKEVMSGREPHLLMDIHTVSEVNMPSVDLSKINGPAHSDDFKNEHNVYG